MRTTMNLLASALLAAIGAFAARGEEWPEWQIGEERDLSFLVPGQTPQEEVTVWWGND